MTDEYKLLRRGGTDKWLVTPEGDQLPVVKIGAGQFARVYATLGPRPVVYVIVPDERNDMAKDVMAQAWRRAPSPHLPSIERVGDTIDAAVYRMPFYKTPLRAGDWPETWKGMRLLQSCALKARAASPMWSRGWDDYSHKMDVTVDCVMRHDRRLGHALSVIRDAADDISPDFEFEFSPRNLATDKAGILILLDPVYDRLKIDEMRSRLHVRRGGIRWV